MTARKVIARKVFWRNRLQHLQTVLQTGQSLELVGHSLEPGGTFVHDLTFCEYLQWATACPEQVTLIPDQ
jgi:hypothetical protein